MSYSQLINLLIILVLINYSYEFNIQNNNKQRRIRDMSLKSDTQNVLNKVLTDQKQFEDQIKKFIQDDRDNMDKITQNIMIAADRMAAAGSKDIISVTQWTSIQGELRQGINLIIAAYRRYINLHRQVCESIENFAKDIISKYETELAAIDQMTAPTSTTSNIDTGSPEWTRFIEKFSQMLLYARAHQQTLRTATDCTADLMTHTLTHQSVIMNPVPATTVIRITNPGYTQYGTDSFTIPCNDVTQYNGYQSCSNGIVAATQGYANTICQCTM